mgnify:CR=1 FL=1
MERLHATGVVIDPLNEKSAREAIATLLKEGCESIAVCLLHALAHNLMQALFLRAAA